MLSLAFPVNNYRTLDLAHTAGVGCLGNFDCGAGRVSRTGQRPRTGCCNGEKCFRG